MMQTTIPNAQLKADEIPTPEADWKEIVQFARTFNGYAEAGSLANAGDLANEYRASAATDRKPLTLRELRICLFFEYRRWKHTGGKPEGADLQYIRFLVERIRDRVQTGKRD